MRAIQIWTLLGRCGADSTVRKKCENLAEAITRAIRIAELQSAATQECPFRLAVYLQGFCCPTED